MCLKRTRQILLCPFQRYDIETRNIVSTDAMLNKYYLSSHVIILIYIYLHYRVNSTILTAASRTFPCIAAYSSLTHERTQLRIVAVYETATARG